MIKNGRFWVLILLLILAVIAIIDIPKDIQIIEYLINEVPKNDEAMNEFIRPNRMALKIVFDALKILSVIFGFLFIFKWNSKPKLTFFIMLIVLLIFLYFDLPIHRCYNGNFESYWEVGRHFH